MPTAAEYAWLAGLIEGEGTFGAHGKGAVRLAVGMTDEDTIRQAHAVSGVGYVYFGPRRSPRQDIWTWAVTKTADAIQLMAVIYPAMSARRQARIEELFERWMAAPPRGGNRLKLGCPYNHGPYDRVRSDGRRGCVACSRVNSQNARDRKR
jgi:hypothetical protein